MFKWLKGKLTNTDPSKSRVMPTTDDLTHSRDIRERIAGIQLGNAFGLETRDGIKIFKLIEIRGHKKKEVS